MSIKTTLPHCPNQNESASYDTQTPVHPGRSYKTFYLAYDHFNNALFDSRLRPALITLHGPRKAMGFFAGKKFVNAASIQTVADEIALNPKWLDGNFVEHFSTILHEMNHQWQYNFGKGSRGRYHNRQWAEQMITTGLMPSSTGQPGGRLTGDRVSHYIIPGGRFETVCNEFLASHMPTMFREQRKNGSQEGSKGRRRRVQAASKTRYSCAVCALNAWAKPGVRLVCEPCEEVLQPESLPPEHPPDFT